MASPQLKILLLQARHPADPVAHHEITCFASATGLDESAFVPHDLLDGPPTAHRVRGHDALMVGGSGDFYVSKGNLPNLDSIYDMLREVVDNGPPMFGSCFGYQMLVQALGGEIVHDPDRTEVGTFEVCLTHAGREDPLFGRLPEVFQAQLGHKDRAIRHPDGIENLASTELSPFQALRIPDRPIWAAQFHPELTETGNRHRLETYREGYAKQIEGAIDNGIGFRASPETSQLLANFIELVFG